MRGKLQNEKFQDNTQEGVIEIRVAVATKGKDRLDDSVADIFGRSPTFTLIDMDENKVKSILVLENPAKDYETGSGPIAVKSLVDADVNVVVATEFGPGASTLLEQHKISMVKVERGLSVKKVLETWIEAPKL